MIDFEAFAQFGGQAAINRKVCCFGNQYNDGNRKRREVLLVLYVSIGRQDRIELASGSRQQLAVAHAMPAHFTGCLDRMSGQRARSRQSTQ